VVDHHDRERAAAVGNEIVPVMVWPPLGQLMWYFV